MMDYVVNLPMLLRQTAFRLRYAGYPVHLVNSTVETKSISQVLKTKSDLEKLQVT